MKKIALLISIAIFSMLNHPLNVLAQKASDESMDLYLLIGQSNMSGRGKVDSLSKVADPNILMLNKDNKWVPATDPLHFDKKETGVGPGLTFAKVMLTAHKERTIGLIPCAVGGTSINKWNPGAFDERTNTHPYDDAIKRALVAMQNGTLKGILWHQGEGDSGRGNAYSLYAGRFEELLNNLGRDLNIPIHQIPIVIGELGTFYIAKNPSGHVAEMNQILNKIANDHPNILCVSSAGLTDRGDQLHFDTNSARILGKRYAEAMIKLQKKVK